MLVFGSVRFLWICFLLEVYTTCYNVDGRNPANQFTGVVYLINLHGWFYISQVGFLARMSEPSSVCMLVEIGTVFFLVVGLQVH